MQSAAACSANTPIPALPLLLLLLQPPQLFWRGGCLNICKGMVFGPLMQLWGAGWGMYLPTQPQCIPSPSLTHSISGIPSPHSSAPWLSVGLCSVPVGQTCPQTTGKERSLQAKEPDERGYQRRQGRRKEGRQPQTWCRPVCVGKHAGKK